MKCLVFSLMLITMATLSNAQPLTESINKAENLIKTGFPKDAAESLEKDMPSLKCSENMPLFVKAHILYVTALSQYEEDATQKSIKHLEDALTQCGEPARQIFHSYLGELYMGMARYGGAKQLGSSGDDISLWSDEQIKQKALSHFMASLENPQQLFQVPVLEYRAIMTEGKDNEKYRPTLYDVLAHRAIDNAPARFSASANPTLFAPMPEFLKLSWTDNADSGESMIVNAFQQLLRLHSNGSNLAALIQADLDRISFFMAGYSKKDTRAWDYLLATYQDNEAVALAAYAKAEALRSLSGYLKENLEERRNSLAEAVKICSDYSKKFPNSDGGKNCTALQKEITKQEINSVRVEAVVLPAQPSLASIDFRNIQSVTCFLYKIPAKEAAQLSRNSFRKEDELKKFLKTAAIVSEWTVSIPAPPDYMPHSTEIEVPALKESGAYCLVVTKDVVFSVDKSEYFSQTFQVSSLFPSFIKEEGGSGFFLVTDRATGAPLKGVSIRLSKTNTSNTEETLITDENGMARLTKKHTNSLQAVFSLKNDVLHATNNIWLGSGYKGTRQNVLHANIFTDRAVYRPGQTVYFKGVLTEISETNVVPVAHANVEAAVRDVNYQEIAVQKLRTDEFGGFDGSFVIPTGVLTGIMTIQTTHGGAYFRVEEYKRPRFEITFDKLKTEYRLNEDVTVSGKAMMLNGLPLENATVSYEVSRYAHRPLWRMYYPEAVSEVVARGTLTTKADGSFEIVFKTLANTDDTDRSFYYNFAVTADVTDITGETQSGTTSFGAGSNSVRINLDVPTFAIRGENDSIRYSFTNYNGEEVSASGRIVIEELVQPKTPYINRYWDMPDIKVIPKAEFAKKFPQYSYDTDSLSVSAIVYAGTLEGKTTGGLRLSNRLAASGKYRITVSVTDNSGKTIKEVAEFAYIKPDEKSLPLTENAVLFLDKNQAAIGENVNIYMGSGVKSAKAFYTYMAPDGQMNQEWLSLDKKMNHIRIPIDKSLMGGFAVYLQVVQNNRLYELQQRVAVTDPNKKLQIEVAGIRDKTLPGAKERWQVKITDNTGKPIPAAMFATMYDASLDKFEALNWNFSVTPNYKSAYINVNSLISTFSHSRSYNVVWEGVSYIFPNHSNLNWFGYSFDSRYRNFGTSALYRNSTPMAKSEVVEEEAEIVFDADASSGSAPEVTAAAQPDAQPRKNFAETAFFYPNLRADKDGNVILEFTMPEALTRWNMQAIGYTQELQIGDFKQSIVTESDFMVMPNLPRYLRTGDECTFTTRIANKTGNMLSGTAKIVVENMATGQALSENITGSLEVPFAVKGNESITVSWNYRQPDNAEALLVRITATSGNFTDGEEHLIPVLPSQVVALETIPVEISKAGTYNYSFKNMTAGSTPQKLAVEMSTSPVWYAIQALPVLAEYPNESSDQVFNRYYAATLGSYILNSVPQIKRVFDQWSALEPDAFLSNLEKNQELKAMLLSETPWVADAQNETARKQRLATLFDLNKLSYSQQQAIAKLRQQQLSNGAFPWFPDMEASLYITRYIVTGIGKLNALGLQNNDLNIVVTQAVKYLDEQWWNDYEKATKNDATYNASSGDIHYLYARSFFTDKKLEDKIVRLVPEILNGLVKEQAKFDFNTRAMLAMVLQRNNKKADAQTIAKSLDNYSIGNSATGKYWRTQQGNLTASGIALSTLMVEVYNIVLQDKNAANEVITWLLRNKRTNDWLTPVATADAVYALVSSSPTMLEATPVSMKIGQKTIFSDTQQQEAGTGYFKVVYDKGSITPDMKTISVTTTRDKQVWGGAYLQYSTSLDKIKGDKTAPLSVERELYKQVDGAWVKIAENEQLQVGDKLSVRLVLRADRDFEYVHLRDMRAASFEPVVQTSGYTWNQLGHYRSVKDASVDLFFDRLPRGTWSIDYELFVTQQGTFSNGYTSIQCMYAPEFSGNSNGMKVTVK